MRTIFFCLGTFLIGAAVGGYATYNGVVVKIIQVFTAPPSNPSGTKSVVMSDPVDQEFYMFDFEYANRKGNVSMLGGTRSKIFDPVFRCDPGSGGGEDCSKVTVLFYDTFYNPTLLSKPAPECLTRTDDGTTIKYVQYTFSNNTTCPDPPTQ